MFGDKKGMYFMMKKVFQQQINIFNFIVIKNYLTKN